MGCRTGFYLLLTGDHSSREILPLIKEMFTFIAGYTYPTQGQCDTSGFKQRTKRQARNKRAFPSWRNSRRFEHGTAHQKHADANAPRMASQPGIFSPAIKRSQLCRCIMLERCCRAQNRGADRVKYQTPLCVCLAPPCRVELSPYRTVKNI